MVFEFNSAPPALLNISFTLPAFATFASVPSISAQGLPISTNASPIVSSIGSGNGKQAYKSSDLCFGSSSRARSESSSSAQDELSRRKPPTEKNDCIPPHDSTPKDALPTKIPEMQRSHPRMLSVERALVTALLMNDIHEEGAHILAKLILDMHCRDCRFAAVFNEVARILGLDAGHPLESSLFTALDFTSGILREALSAYEKDVRRLGVAGEHALLNEGREYTAVPPFITAPADRLLVNPLQVLMQLTSIDTTTASISPTPQLEALSQSFRFLELPAEMRNSVYEALLAPGDIRHTVRYNPIKKQKDLKTASSCEPNILATCIQINREAKYILYAQNTICVTATVEWNIQPIFNQRLLPDRILPNITSLLLVVDCTRIYPEVNKAFLEKLMYWKQLQDMTSLVEIRVCLVELVAKVRLWDNHVELRRDILQEITDRIPAACEVRFEAREGFEDEYVQDAIGDQTWDAEEPIEVERETLEPLFTKGLKSQQGCKSGQRRDYRFVDRSIGSSLTELGKGGRFVLGSGQ